jgi:hypothetical protein
MFFRRSGSEDLVVPEAGFADAGHGSGGSAEDGVLGGFADAAVDAEYRPASENSV